MECDGVRAGSDSAPVVLNFPSPHAGKCNNGPMNEVALLPVRFVSVDDHAELELLDAAYSSASGADPAVTRASLQFYARSGHSFVAHYDGVISGFVLGHAIWTGGHAVIRSERLVTAQGGPNAADVRAALLAALVKSAYDAGVYDLLVEHPLQDAAGAAALEQAGFAERDARLYGRVLGSRAAKQVVQP